MVCLYNKCAIASMTSVESQHCVIKRVFRNDTHKTFMISQTAGEDDSLWAIMRRVYRLTLYKPIK